jgi:hypothetical protein
MPRPVGAHEKKNQTSRVLPGEEKDQLRQVEIDNELAEIKALAREVADAWISDKRGVELVTEQRR